MRRMGAAFRRGNPFPSRGGIVLTRTSLRAPSSSVVILNFHGVGSPVQELVPGEEDVWLSRGALNAVLDDVAARPDVRITFDDGNLSDLTIALPALLARGLTASFFL